MMTEIYPPAQGRYMLAKPMRDLSWLRVGGPADLFQPADQEDLAAVLGALDPALPVMPVGVCSNLIIRDGGIDGLVVRLGRGFAGIAIAGDRVTVGAGALDAHVARKAAAAGLDLTFLRTIPGAMGGAVRMNAGCYGAYIADHFVSATALDRQGRVHELGPDDMGFGYRQTGLPDDMIVTQMVLRAAPGEPQALEAKMEEALAHRARTQPVKERSCGSTFRNPSGASSLKGVAAHEHAAWKLIEAAGMRGARLGGAQMSQMHANFMINTGEATADDLEKLGELVRKRVYEKHQIALEWEIKRVGKA